MTKEEWIRAMQEENPELPIEVITELAKKTEAYHMLLKEPVNWDTIGIDEMEIGEGAENGGEEYDGRRI